MSRIRSDGLLLGEWACLGILSVQQTHGFAIAARLGANGDVGRVWSLSRALTYRALDQLGERGLVRTVGEEPGIAGGNRTILAPTTKGRKELAKWLQTPVAHLRDLRSELLLKLILGGLRNIDPFPLLVAQREQIAAQSEALDAQVDDLDPGRDVVALWRSESSRGAMRFLDRLIEGSVVAQGHADERGDGDHQP